MISPFREDFISTKLRNAKFRENKTLVKIPKFTVIFYDVLSSADIFQNYFFSKKSFQKTLSKGLYPDQDRHHVLPDLGPNNLLRLLADDKICHQQKKS